MAALWSDFDRETLRETKNLIRCICGEEDEEEDNFQLALRFTCSNFRSEEGAANIRLTWKLSVSIYRLSVCFCFSTQFSSFPGRGQSQSSAQHHWVRAWMHWSMSEYMSEYMSEFMCESMAGRSSVWPSVVRVHLFVLSIYMKLMVHSELNKAESWMKLTEEFLTSPLPNTEGTKVCVWFCVCVSVWECESEVSPDSCLCFSSRLMFTSVFCLCSSTCQTHLPTQTSLRDPGWRRRVSALKGQFTLCMEPSAVTWAVQLLWAESIELMFVKHSLFNYSTPKSIEKIRDFSKIQQLMHCMSLTTRGSSGPVG